MQTNPIFQLVVEDASLCTLVEFLPNKQRVVSTKPRVPSICSSVYTTHRGFSEHTRRDVKKNTKSTPDERFAPTGETKYSVPSVECLAAGLNAPSMACTHVHQRHHYENQSPGFPPSLGRGFKGFIFLPFAIFSVFINSLLLPFLHPPSGRVSFGYSTFLFRKGNIRAERMRNIYEWNVFPFIF